MSKKQKKAPPKNGKALVFKVFVDKSRFTQQLLELESRLIGLCDDVPAAVTNGANVVFKRCRPVLDVEGIMAVCTLKNMSEAEIVAHFARYGFTDEAGHPLENCADFLALIALAAKQ